MIQQTILSFFESRHELPFYSEHAKQLEGSTGAKIRAILRQDCLEYVGGSKFICKPIMQKNGKPYNSTTYHLNSIKVCGAWIVECSCQGWQTRAKDREEDIFKPLPICSHSAALYEKFKREATFKQEILRPSPATIVPEVV